jgi:hypothetical protein
MNLHFLHLFQDPDERGGTRDELGSQLFSARISPSWHAGSRLLDIEDDAAELVFGFY